VLRTPLSKDVSFRDDRGRFRKAKTFENNKFFKTNYFRLEGTLLTGIANFEFKTGDGVAEAMVEFGQDLVDYMRDNAPWNDITGDARRGLVAEVIADDNEMTITLMHTVEYGIWLEIRWGGRYAIIVPTVEQKGPEIYDKMKGMCGDIIYYYD
jgi:hypothetical protein